MAPHITPMASFRAMLIVSCAHTIIAYKTNDNSASQAIRQIKVYLYLYAAVKCTSSTMLGRMANRSRAVADDCWRGGASAGQQERGNPAVVIS